MVQRSRQQLLPRQQHQLQMIKLQTLWVIDGISSTVPQTAMSPGIQGRNINQSRRWSKQRDSTVKDTKLLFCGERKKGSYRRIFALQWTAQVPGTTPAEKGSAKEALKRNHWHGCSRWIRPQSKKKVNWTKPETSLNSTCRIILSSTFRRAKKSEECALQQQKFKA